ncbi:MAG: tyrosine--tRNA ligase, partial [Flavobacteriaceae bacterium]
SREELDNALRASNILFGKSTSEDLKKLNEKTFLEVFDGVPQAEVDRAELENGLDMIGALADKTGFLASNSEARRELKQNSISVNKEKVKEDYAITNSDLINDKFVLLQRGKKNYFVLVVK